MGGVRTSTGRAAVILGLLVVVGLASLWPAGSAGGASTSGGAHLAVRPAVGLPGTHFIVSFTAQRSGYVNGTSRSYWVTVYGPRSQNCDTSEQVTVPPTGPGERVHVTLVPRAGFQQWCEGAYAGSINELIRPDCSGQQLCPQAVGAEPSWIEIVHVGRFKLRVK